MNLTRAMVSSLAASILAACASGESTGGVSFPANEQAFDAGVLPSITEFISNATFGNNGNRVFAQLISGPPPISRNPAPGVTALAGGFTIPGGSKIVGVNGGGATYSRVLLKVRGATDYYELTGFAPTSYDTLIFSLPQTAARTFTAEVAVSPGPTDPIGPYTALGVSLTTVGTGDVQVSLAFDAPSDIDLHVVEPDATGLPTVNSFEIYYGASLDTTTQGKLDLDSNAACGIDGKDNENITWQGGTPPRGQYIVRVDNWDACGQATINYVVTINVKGQPTQLYQGVFTDAGDHGGYGGGVEVARFTY
jgi:hypothetical protein